MGSGPSLDRTMREVENILQEQHAKQRLTDRAVQGAAESIAALFHKYDTDGDNVLQSEEMTALAHDIDEKLKNRISGEVYRTDSDRVIGVQNLRMQANKTVGQQLLTMWDRDQSKTLNAEEFNVGVMRLVSGLHQKRH